VPRRTRPAPGRMSSPPWHTEVVEVSMRTPIRTPFVRVLGPVAVEYEGQPVALGSPQSRALLSLLLVRRGEVVSTEWIIDGLWGATPPPSARAQVQNRVCWLRSVICADPGD